jgi:hypothetical protein
MTTRFPAVVVDPRGRGPSRHRGRISGRSTSLRHRRLDVSLGGLPAGRRPVAVLDKSIVLVPGSTAGPPVELWAGGSDVRVVDGAGRFAAASDDRVATVADGCTSCALRISTSQGDLVQEVAPFTGFQPVSTGSFSPNGRYVVVRNARAPAVRRRAIADLRTGSVDDVGGDDARRGVR